MDIDKMEAGPEMDARVATDIMKWTAERKPGLPHLWLPPGHFISGWQPSKDISAAWLVVEKMRELGWNLEIGVSFHDANTYAVCCWKDPIYDDEHYIADTAPVAICRAALKAME